MAACHAYSKNTSIKLSIFTRVLVALIGGFALANMAAIIISSLLAIDQTGSNVDNIVAGMMISFIIYLLVTLLVFSTKKARTALLIITTACAFSFGFIIMFLQR